MKLKHPLRYYLTNRWVDVGGIKVEYTPANVHRFDLVLDGKKVGHLRVIGGYAFTGLQGLDLVDVSHHYAGEL